MTRSITFIPRARSSADNEDLHYIEHGSRSRSIHALFQDGAAQRTASRRQFLLKSYREVVARFAGTGRIEHPLPFLRQLSQFLDGLSQRVDCRVDDFGGLGVYVLVRHADAFYLLASRDGSVLLDTGDGFESLARASERACVKELQLETAGAQQELFSHSMRDHLGLYRIDPTEPAQITGQRAGTVLRAVMGAAGDDVTSVLAALPELVSASAAEQSVELPQTAQKVVYASFAPARPVRDPVLDALRAGETGRRPRRYRLVTTLVTTVVLLGLGSVWITARMPGGTEVVQQPEVAPTEEPDSAPDEARATQESSPRLRASSEESEQRAGETIDPDVEAPVVDEPPAIGMALEWRRTYTKPVTTTPAIDGDRVIFGSRDGNVYSVDRTSGEGGWSYSAGAGVGASPVVAGGVVVGANYDGNVFCLDKSTGETLWTRALPARVVSTPCVAGGEVLVGCTDGKGYGLSLETGRILWQVDTRVRIRASAVAANGHFYLPSYSGWLYAIAQGSGAVSWRREIGGQLASTPAADERRVVVGGEEGIYSLDARTGERQWRFRTGQPVNSFILMENGHVYAGSNDRHVYCLDAETGERVWRARTGEAVLSRPRLVDDVLFVTSYDKYVYCLNAATGELIDRFQTNGSIYSSPVVAGDHVFFGNNQGEFYCINYRKPASQ